VATFKNEDIGLHAITYTLKWYVKKLLNPNESLQTYADQLYFMSITLWLWYSDEKYFGKEWFLGVLGDKIRLRQLGVKNPSVLGESEWINTVRKKLHAITGGRKRIVQQNLDSLASEIFSKSDVVKPQKKNGSRLDYMSLSESMQKYFNEPGANKKIKDGLNYWFNVDKLKERNKDMKYLMKYGEGVKERQKKLGSINKENAKTLMEEQGYENVLSAIKNSLSAIQAEVVKQIDEAILVQQNKERVLFRDLGMENTKSLNDLLQRKMTFAEQAILKDLGTLVERAALDDKLSSEKLNKMGYTTEKSRQTLKKQLEALYLNKESPIFNIVASAINTSGGAFPGFSVEDVKKLLISDKDWRILDSALGAGKSTESIEGVLVLKGANKNNTTYASMLSTKVDSRLKKKLEEKVLAGGRALIASVDDAIVQFINTNSSDFSKLKQTQQIKSNIVVTVRKGDKSHILGGKVNATTSNRIDLERTTHDSILSRAEAASDSYSSFPRLLWDTMREGVARKDVGNYGWFNSVYAFYVLGLVAPSFFGTDLWVDEDDGYVQSLRHADFFLIGDRELLPKTEVLKKLKDFYSCMDAGEIGSKRAFFTLSFNPISGAVKSADNGTEQFDANLVRSGLRVRTNIKRLFRK